MTTTNQPVMLKMSRMTKTTKDMLPRSSHLGRYMPLTLLFQSRTRSLTVSYLPVLVTLQPLYFPSLSQRDVGVCRLQKVRSASSLLRASSIVPSANYFFIVLDSNGFRSYRHRILKRISIKRWRALTDTKKSLRYVTLLYNAV